MTLDELIVAAQKEGEVNTYWHSSRMGKKVAKAFEEKYGVKVNATKMKDSEMTERIVREVTSGNNEKIFFTIHSCRIFNIGICFNT
jgi:iron(III) transport system substrate-binding protein